MTGVTGQMNSMQTQSNTASTRMQKAFSGIGKVAMVAGAAIASGFGAALVMGIKGVTEGEDAIAQLDAVLKSTGGSAGVMRKDLLDMADQMQKTTKFTQEDTLAAESLLLTFTNIGSTTFPAATRAAADMATALGTDMAGQSIALGKALNDPIKGITALSRVGVSFTEGQKASIKAMQESGDMAGAQTIILKELEKEFGGSAEAAGKTFSGQLEILKNAFGEVTEALALQFMPTLQDMMDWVMLHMPEIQATAKKAFDTIANAIKWVTDNSNWLIPVLKSLAVVFIALKVISTVTPLIAAFNLVLSLNPVALVILALAALGLGIVALVKNWDKVTGAISKAWDWLTRWNNKPIKNKYATVTTNYVGIGGGMAGGTSGGSGGRGGGGGFAIGSRYVPYDMVAQIHQGEMIVPKSENPYANSGNGRTMPTGGNGLNLTITNFVNNRSQDVQSFAEELQFYMKQKQMGGSR